MASTLKYPFEVRDEPEFIRSDIGPEFTAEAVWTWLRGSPSVNASRETFNSRLRVELPDRKVFETLKAANVILE